MIFKELDNSSIFVLFGRNSIGGFTFLTNVSVFIIRMGTDGEVEEKEGLQQKSTPSQDQIVAVIGDPSF